MPMDDICKEAGCGRPVVARKLCNTHYHAWRRHAQKDGTFDNKKPRDLVERFWKYVDKSGEHWMWTGPVNNAGYGRLITQTGSKTSRVAVMAHRLSYEIHHGPIPEGHKVLHRCDIRLCVHPECLFTGTTKDNAQDMSAKLRNRIPTRFNAEEVREIREARASGVPVADLAAFHSVSLPLIYKVLYKTQPYDFD